MNVYNEVLEKGLYFAFFLATVCIFHKKESTNKTHKTLFVLKIYSFFVPLFFK